MLHVSYTLLLRVLIGSVSAELSLSLAIGQSDNFGFDFAANNWLMLFDFSLCNEWFPIECLGSNQAITLVFVFVLPQFEIS